MIKKCTVVMLPSKKAENFLVLSLNKLWFFFKGYFIQEYLQSQNKKSFHLYILSDEEIKEDDLWIGHIIGETEEESKLILVTPQNRKEIKYNVIKSKFGKIIATTDSSLTLISDLDKSGFKNKWNSIKDTKELPQPSPQFIAKYIEEYNKGNIITEVMVEYEDYSLPNGVITWIFK